MVSIYMDGEDKTGKISNWEIRAGSQGELMLVCYFPSGKSYTRPLSKCEIIPTEQLQGNFFVRKGGVVFSAVDKAVIYGGKYVVVQYPGNSKKYPMDADGLTFITKTTIKDEAVFRYFLSVAKARAEKAGPNQKPIADNVLNQLEKVLPHADTALHAYCTGKCQSREQMEGFIYPFGVNESQLKAVEHALTSQISLIEGPPGTGKTQTILNIIANIVLCGKTVAILSNNNAAVENIYEKLGKTGLGYLVAKLGNADNRKGFFADVPAMPSEDSTPSSDMQHIQVTLQKLKQHLHATE